MNNNWKIFFPCINEKPLIEAKIQWGLRLGFEISVAEGYHPSYKKFNPETHLSIDGTTEILKSYSDQITYIPIGEVPHEAFLRDTAYANLSKSAGICIMSDADEFFLEEDLEQIDAMFSANKNLKLVLTNSHIFLDNEFCAPHVQRKDGNPIEFNKGLQIWHGQFHERIFRYDKFYSYKITPFLVNDLYGRCPFNHPIYYGERELRDDIYLLHYKQFKLAEAKERQKIYHEQDNKDYDKEWRELKKNKIRYEGKHPIEIERLMK